MLDKRQSKRCTLVVLTSTLNDRATDKELHEVLELITIKTSSIFKGIAVEVWQLIQRADNLRDLMTNKGNADEAIAEPQHRSISGVAILKLVSRESIVAKCSTIVDTD